MIPQDDRDIRSRRVFKAMRNTLWDAFRDPAKLARWWGPAGFTNEFHAFEFRAGGEWNFTMTGPDGALYRMRKVFAEISEPGRIVLDHPDPVHGFRMFMDFREVPGGTELGWLMRFDHAGEATRVRPFVETANEQNFDRLEKLLKEVPR